MDQQRDAARHGGLGVLTAPARHLTDLFDPGDGDAVLHVHVQPRSGRDEITGRHGNALRVRVQAPPVDGRATEAVRRLIAGVLDVTPGRVTLVSGERSRLKRFRLEGISRGAAAARLGIVLAGRG